MPDNILDILLYSREETSHDSPGQPVASTRRSILRGEVEATARGLVESGFQPGDRLAIWAETRYEWLVAELAAMLAGGSVVGIDPHVDADAARYVIEHSEATALLIGASAAGRKGLTGICSSLKFVGSFDDPARIEGAPESMLAWSRIFADNRGNRWDHGTPSDGSPATIIYTSGTTGWPKGIEYTHRQLTVAWQAILNGFPQLSAGDTTICWLPMCHLFQRMMNYVAIARDLTIAFVSDPQQMRQALQETRPTVLVGVPRFFEKLHSEMIKGIDRQPRLVRKTIQTALRLKQEIKQSDDTDHLGIRGKRIVSSWLDPLLLKRLRNVLGGRVKFMITGSAPTPRPVLEFFDSLGVPLLEAYGLSENTIPVAANRPGDYRFGSVGKPFPETEIKLAEDNEILIKGPGVFRGYFRDETAKDLFSTDEFLHTGDIGHFDRDGFLYLTGRKSDLIKTSTGRRISPAPIEAVYRRTPLVEHIVVFGEGRKHLGALVTLSDDNRDLGEELRIRERIQIEFDRLGAELPHYERIRRFAILPRPFRVSEGELTASLKLRRGEIAAKYRELIESLFSENEDAFKAESVPVSSSWR